jgi:hypothetical protein
MSGTSFTRYANCSNGAICGTGGSICTNTSGATCGMSVGYDYCYGSECPNCVLQSDQCKGTLVCGSVPIANCTACGCTLSTTANKFYSSLTSPTLVYTASSVPNTCQWIPPTVASSVEPLTGIESMLASIVDAISQLLKSLRGY